MMQTMQPRIIPRNEHRISRKQISYNVLRTLYRLRDNGFVAYLVGGCVRDLLLERTPKDFDIATDATPAQIKRLFRNCRLVGRRFRLAHLYFKDEILEVSTFRASTPPDDEEIEEELQSSVSPRHLKNEDGMVLRDNVFGTPEEDALRRDFTVNALAYNIADFTVIDYSTGLSDLQERLIRPIGDPYIRFTEDPVRMIRAVRFAASHNFEIEPATWETICELSNTISRASPSRMYEEIQKLFLLGAARPVFDLMEKSGLLAAIFPSLSQWLSGNDQHITVLRSNLEYIDRLCRSENQPSASLFFAAFFGLSLEEAIVEKQREGIPRQQALDAVSHIFMKELQKTVNVPRRISNKMRAILSMQPSLRRRPPRRPFITVNKPDFADALAYLRLTAEIRGEGRAALRWWDEFISGDSEAKISEQASEETPAKKPRKRRRRRRPPVASDKMLPEDKKEES